MRIASATTVCLVLRSPHMGITSGRIQSSSKGNNGITRFYTQRGGHRFSAFEKDAPYYLLRPIFLLILGRGEVKERGVWVFLYESACGPFCVFSDGVPPIS